MIWLMITLLLGGSIFTIGCAVYGAVKLKKDPLEKYVFRALIFCASTMAVNAVAMLMRKSFPALLFYGVYHALADCTVISMFVFILRYLGFTRSIGKARLSILIWNIIDVLALLINCFTKVMYDVELYQDKFGWTFCRICDYGAFYWVHGVFLLILLFVIMGLLAGKIVRDPKAYALRYAAILFALMLIVVTNVCHIVFGFKYDYSLIFYPFVAFFVFYFSMVYVPRGLMERLLVLTFASMKDGVICIDIDNKIVHANRASRAFAEADVDINSLEVQIRKWLLEKVDNQSPEDTWEEVRRMDGIDHYFTIDFRRIFDGSEKYLGSFFLIQDNTEEYIKLYNERQKSTHDGLTGLYNKEQFYALTRQMLDSNPDEEYYIIMTDIKNFKIVNDVFGVEVGDNLLKEVAKITATFGGSDCVYARITNDRFAICMPKRRFSEDALLRSYSVIDSFLSNAAFKTHIHIGVYEVKDRTLRISVMCDRANLAIKKIKDSYRSYVAYYDAELRASFISEHRVISEFEKALATNQFHTYIQPQIASDGAILGGEALVRWIHPQEGTIPPNQFIKLFEQTGLIGRLDKYMWEKACQHLRRWHDAGLRTSYISVNISQKDFYLLDVYTVITELVKKYNLPPRALHLEITETALMNDPKSQMELIARLRKCGFIVEIDDFGSGYSSLNMLKELESDVLKIDMGFLKKTDHPDRSHAILRMIIAMAKVLKMEIITEGVETPDQFKFLADYGCDVYQGYLFAKPMPTDEFERGYLNKRYNFKVFESESVMK